MIHLTTAGMALLAGSALLAAMINAVAGGGSLLSFPTLLLLGFPALVANVSNTIGLVTGYAGGSLGYRAELSHQGPRVRYLGAIAGAGALAGAWLLTLTSPGVFRAIVPWLILAGSALLATQPLLARRARAAGAPPSPPHRARALAAATLLSGAYGAFFGAGLGVMLIAVLEAGITDTLQRLNALKGLLSLIINVVAAVFFAIHAPVAWDAVALMVPASLVGGFAGAAVARRLPAVALRTAVVLLGTAVAVRLLV